MEGPNGGLNGGLNGGFQKRYKWLRRLPAIIVILALAGAAGFGWLIVMVSWMEDTVDTVTSPPVEAIAGVGVWNGYDRSPYDCIIVMGAQVKPNGMASEALIRRMELALEYYRVKRTVIIVTGGQGADEPMAEGDFMYNWMLGRGVPAEMLAVDNTSRNTRENIGNAKSLMDERGLKRALVVTSDYHVPRSLAVCREMGIGAVGAGSESSPDMWWKNHLRESLSWIKYKLGF